MTQLRTLSFCLIGFAAAACSSTSSSSLSTSQIKMQITATLDNDPGSLSTEVIANLSPGDMLSSVKLSDGDTLTVSTDQAAAIPMVFDTTALNYSIDTTNVLAGTILTIALNRASGTSAPNTTATIPAAIALTAPTPNAVVSYAGGTGMFQVTWSNAISGGGDVHFFPYPCGSVTLSSNDITGPDNGSFSMATSKLVISAPGASGQCVTLRIGREGTSKLDPALDSESTFSLTRYDYVNIMVMP